MGTLARGDVVYIGGMTPIGLHALQQWIEDHQILENVRVHMAADDLAYIIALLRAWPDDVAVFPHGKWATIQYLDVVLMAHMPEEIKVIKEHP